jgi:hypothetical protein
MSLTLTNLLDEYKLGIRDSDESAADCYTALNSVKDEAVTKILDYLKLSGLNSAPSEFSITMVADTYTYALSGASPAIGYILEVKTNNGLGVYRPMRRIEAAWYKYMSEDPLFPEYRLFGNKLEIRGEPNAGDYVKIEYLGTITDVSGSWATTTSGLTDEAQRMWCWYAAARNWENVHEDKEAQRCYKIFNQKLFGTQRGF